MSSTQKAKLKLIAKQIKEISQKVKSIQMLCQSLDVSVEQKEPIQSGEDSIPQVKRKRKSKRLKKIVQDDDNELVQPKCEVKQINDVLTEEKYCEALSRFIVQQRKSIRNRYPTFKNDEIASVALQCWDQLNIEQQNTIIKTMLSSKKQFSALVAQEKRAIHQFFQELKKSRKRQFYHKDPQVQKEKQFISEQQGKKSLVPQKNIQKIITQLRQNKRDMDINNDKLILQQQKNPNLLQQKYKVNRDKKIIQDESIVNRHKQIKLPDGQKFENKETPEQNESKIIQQKNNYLQQMEFTENANSDSMYMNLHEDLSPIEEEGQENSRLTLSEPTNTKKRIDQDGNI